MGDVGVPLHDRTRVLQPLAEVELTPATWTAAVVGTADVGVWGPGGDGARAERVCQ